MNRFKNGFTLIEVLVATAILALISTILIKSEINTIALSARNSAELQAIPVASGAMDDVSKMQIDGEYKEIQDEFTIYAVQGLYPGSALPIDVTTLTVLLGDTEYAKIRTFKIKFF